jgi:hypothetical protein
MLVLNPVTLPSVFIIMCSYCTVPVVKTTIQVSGRYWIWVMFSLFTHSALDLLKNICIHSSGHSLFADKELVAAKERQEIELAAQRATLQEQRTHIDILDTALTNAQGNVVRLEEEVSCFVRVCTHTHACMHMENHRSHRSIKICYRSCKSESYHPFKGLIKLFFSFWTRF